MKPFPIFLDLSGREVLVVGGGAVAERKIKTLLEAGAVIRVISPSFTAGLQKFARENKLSLIQRVYEEGDLTDAQLVFVATDQACVNRAVALEAKTKNIWVNVADRSCKGDFILPALYREPQFTLAVSTEGESPKRAVQIRNELKAVLLAPSFRDKLGLVNTVDSSA